MSDTPQTENRGPDRDFVREQYIQYHEIRRQLNGFSWQIPSVAAVVLVLFLGLEPDKAAQWLSRPLLPALGLLAVGLFMAVMRINLVRNVAFLRNLERICSQMEREYGVEFHAYAKEFDRSLPAWRRVRSSTCLAAFLLIAMVGTLAGSAYFWVRLLSS